MNRIDSLPKVWTFTFLPAYYVLASDVIARLILLVSAYEHNIDLRTNIFIQVLISLFTFWFAKRNIKSKKAFLKMRLLSEAHNKSDQKILYSNIDVNLRSTSLKANKYLLVILTLIPILSSVSLLIHFDHTIYTNLGAFTWVVLFGWAALFLSFYYLSYRIFISNKIVSIKIEDEKLGMRERAEIVLFLNRNSSMRTHLKLEDQNDFLIIELQTKLKIYRERLENLSLEGIFLGALTFATFTQFTSPENLKLFQDMAINKPHELFSGIRVYTQTISQFDQWFVGDELSSKFAIAIITFGSLISSTLYLIVLIKRFSILKTIEMTQLLVERANVWNQREQKELEGGKDSFATKFTDQIQIELSQANEMAENIQSNLNLTSIIRAGGVFAFFSIILVSAEMIEHQLFIILFTFALYGFLANFLMNLESNLKRVFQSKREADRFIFVKSYKEDHLS
jgi:hypothetical protein